MKGKTRNKIIALILGIALVPALFEIGLRIAGRYAEIRLFAKIEGTCPEGTESFTIVTIGDSHTQGIGAPDGLSYPDQLEAILRAADLDHCWIVRNEGRAGFNSSQALHRLEKILQEKQPPDLVLALVGTNNDHNLADATFLPEALIGQNIHRQVDYLFRNSKAYRFGRVTVKNLRQLLNKAPEDLRHLEGDVITEDDFVVQWLINDYRAMKSRCDQVGCTLVLIGYPKSDDRPQQALRTLEKEQAHVVHTLGFGLGAKAMLRGLWAKDGHPNEKGYSLMAATIARYIAEANLIPATPAQVTSALNGSSKS